MAPKAAAKQEKAKVAAKQKVAEDKTFGLKNKNKSSKVQKYVQTVQKQATQEPKRPGAAEPDRKNKKKAEEDRQKELAALFAVAIKQPKVPAGVDPKSVVCEFYRHGQCTKGFKCKYSHDLSVERKGHKIDLFTDQRDGGEEGEEGGMEEWDQQQLEKVVAEKHGKENKNRPTEIVCKYFLDAVERRLYGWFWKCPNGEDCKYRHALPPGYVLKSQMKELLEEEARNQKDVAEQIEEERAQVDARTPLTQQVFLEWRRGKVEEKQRKAEEDEAERKRKGLLNGREIFLQDGFVVVDDAGASEDNYSREGREEEERAERAMHELALQRQAAARAAEGTPSEASASDPTAASTSAAAASTSAAAAGPSTAAVPAGDGASTSAGVSTTLDLRAEEQQQLFAGEDDDDDDEDIVDDDDDGEEDLEALEAALKASRLAS